MIPFNLNKQAIGEIQKSSGATLPLIIKDIIKTSSTDINRMKILWDEYLGNVPIKDSSKSTNPARPDNRLASDFRSTIVNSCTGYFLGNPIDISLPDGESSDDTLAQSLISKFLKKNYYSKADAELETYIATCGKAYRLLFYSTVKDYTGADSTEVIFKNIKPWEGYVIYDGTIDEPTAGMIFYQIELSNSPTKKFRTKVEFYDSSNVYYFVEDEVGNYVTDSTYGEAVQAHGFNGIPVIEFKNNTTSTGDFEKVRSLIDGYDRLISGEINSAESFASAYLLFYGVEPTTETIQQARVTGAFYIPKDNEGDSNNEIKFLTKPQNTQNISELCKILNRDILRFSATVDYSSDEFASAQSGEARKYKLIALENKVKEKERLFTQAYQQLFKVVCSFWQVVKGISINYESIEFIFTRNLPLDLSVADIISLHEAQIISTETAIDNLTFIDDTEAELELVNEEKALYGNIINLDTTDTTVTGSAE